MMEKFWHLFRHKWTIWLDGEINFVSYIWTKPGCYAYRTIDQIRRCQTCGKLDQRKEIL